MRKYLIFCVFMINILSCTAQIEIWSDFPGGNISIDKISNDSIWIKPDLRDTKGVWFYWYFAVKEAKGRKITFLLPSNSLTKAGVSVSIDGGETWKWEQPDSFNKNSFVYSFSSDNEIRFSMGIPYTQSNWEKFISRYKNDSAVELTYLAKTKKGRLAEMVSIKKDKRNPKIKILFTARHHACEMMANYVMEGIFETVVMDQWMRDNVEFLFIPFIDKDGVENGDQGKNRIPRDHNRDYSEISIHETTAAIRDFIPRWTEKKPNICIDIHCPWIHSGINDSIFFVGAQNKQKESRQIYFSNLVKKNNYGELIYDSRSFCYYGSKEWTIPTYPSTGTKFSTWALDLENNILGVSLEIPYGINANQCVTAENSRAFGHDLAAALREFLFKLKT